MRELWKKNEPGFKDRGLTFAQFNRPCAAYAYDGGSGSLLIATDLISYFFDLIFSLPKSIVDLGHVGRSNWFVNRLMFCNPRGVSGIASR